MQIHNVLHLSYNWGTAGINQGQDNKSTTRNNKPKLKCENLKMYAGCPILRIEPHHEKAFFSVGTGHLHTCNNNAADQSQSSQ